MLRNSETWNHIVSNLKLELSEVRSEYGGLKIQSSGDDTRQSIAHRSTPCVAVAPPLFFPSSGPGPLATSSAAHSPFVGREVRPIHDLQCLGMPGNILGRLPGRESFVQHYSHLHTSYSPRSSSFRASLLPHFLASSMAFRSAS